MMHDNMRREVFGVGGTKAAGIGCAVFTWIAVCATMPAQSQDTVPAQSPEISWRAADVWIISTRDSAGCASSHTAKTGLRYWRLDRQSHWHRLDGEAFRAADDPDVPTNFFVHGNRTTRQLILADAWPLLKQLEHHAAGRPFRYVIWSWPADRVPGTARKDVLVKAARSDTQSYLLAQCIRGMSPEVRVSMIGYSFGARVITGALHLLGGGQVSGRSLGQPVVSRRVPIRAVLVAAAIDYDWLAPGRRSGLALSQVDRMLVTRNTSDPVLRHYPLMNRKRSSKAMGFAGLAAPRLRGTQQRKVEILRLDRSVGKAHAWKKYLGAAALRRRLPLYVFLDPPH